MRLLVPLQPLKRGLRWAKWILFAGGVAMLAYCGFVLADTWLFQNRERHRLERLLAERHAAAGRVSATAAQAPALQPAVIDGLIGQIEIPRLGLSAIVMEGTDRITLRRAAGHIAGTALPGQPGNVGIAAHRDTFFRPLRNIRRNDIITLTTLLGEYRYRVVSTKIVPPSDIAVLNPSPNEVLTLVTCYPFYFVGSAPSRFIVRAERVGNAS
ncbi:MAG: class D sortase [Bryobacteraceae bacterium]|jgi:sortase A